MTVVRQPLLTRGSFVILCILSLLYGYGVALQLNALLDFRPEDVYRVAVQDKSVTRGKSTAYVLKLRPWGPIEKPNSVRVTSSMYAGVRPGEVIHVVLKRGALGVKWYFIRN
jgi:hypothetical protein